MKLVAQVSPITTLGTLSTSLSKAVVPITVDGFTDIGSCALKIIYDPAVATPTGITTGPRLGGTANFNLTVPGEIRIGWYASKVVTLNSGDTIFNITFNQVSKGKTNLGFDDESNGRGCKYTTVVDGISQTLDDSPLSTYYIPGTLTFSNESPGTLAPMLTASVNDNITIPVKVKNFNNIGVVSLTLNYDPAVLSFNSAVNTDGGFPNLVFNGDKPGTVIIGGSTTNINGVSLPDEFILFKLNFKYLGGTSVLSWNNDFSSSCEYGGTFPDYNILNDEPFTKYYINGLIEPTQLPLSPAIVVGIVENPTTCGGNGIVPLTFTNVPDGTYTVFYNSGSFSNIAVSASAATIGAPAGTYNNLQITVNGVTSEEGVDAVLTDPEKPAVPAITVGGPTTFCQGGSVTLTSDEASAYLWSTGETTQSITVSASGNYSVNVTNGAVCSASSEFTVVIVNAKQEQPAQVNCWDDYRFNESLCAWENKGTAPLKPEKENCWDNFVFNATTCVWDNTGTQPTEPTQVNCWDEFTFSTNSCRWENTGVQPEKPVAANCWDDFQFNESNCVWENKGTAPMKPEKKNCWDEFIFYNNTCQWENIGVQQEKPAMVNCWDNFVFTEATCSWVNFGAKPLEPARLKSWDEFIFNPVSCTWENIGVATVVEIYGNAVKMTLTCYPNPMNDKSTIKYLLPENGQVNIEVTGILGNRINLINNRKQFAGEYVLELDGEQLAAGIYQITLRLTGVNRGAWSKTIRMIKQ